MKASDLFVQALEAEGVEYIFGVPGEENIDMLESLRTSGIRLVLTRHEQAAGFMAATNLVTAAAFAKPSASITRLANSVPVCSRAGSPAAGW